MKTAFSIPVFFLLCACACAQIEGPEQVGIFRLVKLRSVATADGYAWSVASQADTVDIQAIGDGREAVFVGPPGEYVVTLLATTVDWDARQFDQKQSAKRIKIVNDDPGPEPGPRPNPTPGPLPDGAYKLAQFSFDAAQQVPATHRHYAARLASTFESVAAQLSAGTITSITAANNKVKSDNAAILGNDRTTWQTWLNAMNTRMTELWGQHQSIQTISGMASAYREIATGLRAVK